MRHEKIVLVILGYIIGFTTAFIGYNLSSSSDFEVITLHDGFDPSVISASATQVNASESPKILLDATGLYIVKDGEQAVISGALQNGIEPGFGFHFDVPFFALSPSADFVYYCEQETELDDTCNQYIYSVAKHTSYPLKQDPVRLVLSNQTDGFVWTSDSLLSNGSFVSTSVSEPWKLVLPR